MSIHHLQGRAQGVQSVEDFGDEPSLSAQRREAAVSASLASGTPDPQPAKNRLT
jgi:hypothetical protein